MYFTDSEKYVLAMLASGMLQAGLEDGIITRPQWESSIANVCSQLNTPQSILTTQLNIDPFSTIRNMTMEQKQFVKNFFYGIIQQVPNCEKAIYYFSTTLENSGLTINI